MGLVLGSQLCEPEPDLLNQFNTGSVLGSGNSVNWTCGPV
jgi:hypothetical protein